MLTAEENDLLTRVGPGTPMGALFRRFWMPAFLADELPEPDGAPIRIRLLGEDLVAFRDSNGRIGAIDAYCAHRRAPLFFGRNEACGLRCAYHGWKYDVEGICVDMPSESPESNFRDKLRLKAYPCREYGGVVWVYMGPADKVPELPRLEWAELAASRRTISYWINQANWLQGMEGDIDTSHVSYLHSRLKPDTGMGVVRPEGRVDGAPRLSVQDTDAGFAYGGRRTLPEGRYYWRVTQWLLPAFSLIPAYSQPKSCTGWMPVDDHHTLRFSFLFNAEGPMAAPVAGRATPREWGPFELPDGGVIDTWIPEQRKRNLYGLDRQRQRTDNYSGIEGISTQDRAMTEGMGYVCDRTQEHLGTSDVAIIAARRRLLRMVRDLQQGIEPYVASHGDLYRVRALDVISDESELPALLESNAEQLQAPALKA
ncbi:MAG: Rieske 2Fe-2S domain-containing protein [Chloroflexota bacterium]